MGFYGALLCSVLFSVLCTVFQRPLLLLLGADSLTLPVTARYLVWTVSVGAAPAILNVVMAHMIRSEGSAMHASIGTMSGALLNILLDPVFVLPWGLDMGAEGGGACHFFVQLHCAWVFSRVSAGASGCDQRCACRRGTCA